MLIDMHLHSAEYSPDSDLQIVDAIVRAKQLGLDGLCVTDHGAEQAMRRMQNGYPKNINSLS
jgi:PHP domain.